MDGSPSVGLKEAFQKAISNWKDCNSRSRRSEFWWVWLIFVILEIPFNILSQIFAQSQSAGFLSLIFSLVALVVAICILCIMIPLMIRRLHDTGRSGWWYFIVLIPLIGGIILLVFMALDSQRESNEYGPSPKYSSSSGGYSSSNMI